MAAVDSFQLLYRELSGSCRSYCETLALVGALYAASRAVVLLRDCCTLVRVHFLPRMIPSRKLSQRFGDWAVVYGEDEQHGAYMVLEIFVRDRRVSYMRFILVSLYFYQ